MREGNLVILSSFVFNNLKMKGLWNILEINRDIALKLIEYYKNNNRLKIYTQHDTVKILDIEPADKRLTYFYKENDIQLVIRPQKRLDKREYSKWEILDMGYVILVAYKIDIKNKSKLILDIDYFNKKFNNLQYLIEKLENIRKRLHNDMIEYWRNDILVDMIEGLFYNIINILTDNIGEKEIIGTYMFKENKIYGEYMLKILELALYFNRIPMDIIKGILYKRNKYNESIFELMIEYCIKYDMKIKYYPIDIDILVKKNRNLDNKMMWEILEEYEYIDEKYFEIIKKLIKENGYLVYNNL